MARTDDVYENPMTGEHPTLREQSEDTGDQDMIADRCRRSCVQSPPPGTRYDQLARTPLHRWWRPLAGTLVLVIAYQIFVPVVLAVMSALASEAGVPPGTGDQFVNPTWNTAAVLLWIAVWTPAVLFTARWVQRRPAGSVSSVAGRLRGRWLLYCTSAAIAYATLFFPALVLFSLFDISIRAQKLLGWVGWNRFLAPAIVVLLLVPLQAAAEEYVFRGWLLQAVGAYFRSPWPGIIVSSVLFCLAHGVFADNVWAFADLTLLGVVLAVLTIRTGGLEAPIALHTANNYVWLLLAAASGKLDLASLADYSGYSWQDFAVTVPALAVFAVLIIWLARRRGLATVTAQRLAIRRSGLCRPNQEHASRGLVRPRCADPVRVFSSCCQTGID